jgi:precorrin-6A/cobalt-precorrin-6A reductase
MQGRATLYARVLPTVEAIATAQAAGWTSDRLFAMRPPIGLELEMALWQHWQIDLVVTKASGTAGGEDIKIQAAKQLNIPLIVIERPKIKYPLQTSRLEEIAPFCQKYIY